MNILQILPELNVGGVETGTLDLARYLVKMGHKAVVISAGGSLVKDLEAAGAKHYELPVHKKSLINIFKLIPRVNDIIKREEIDIVHARSRVPAWIGFFASRKTARTFITTCHGYYSRHPFSAVMGWGRRVIVLSNVIGRHMIEDFHVPHERIRLVARSVDLDRFNFVGPETKRAAGIFNVGIIGRITPLKGHLHFIKAMAKVAKIVPNLKIWIVGEAPESKEAYKEQLHILVKRLGLTQCTQFLGTQRDIPGILSHLDLLVLATTTHEAFGRVIVEAQAAGVPVVATKVGGVIDVIDDEKTGLLVSAADPEAMAQAALRIYNDPALAKTLAGRAIEKVRNFYTVEKMVQNTVSVYEEALRSRKILVIKFSSLGDIILSTPGLRALRERFKENYYISVLVKADFKEALMGCPYIDELLVCDFQNRDKGLAGFWSLGSSLRRRGFDIVIDLQNNRKSHLLAFLSAAVNRYGYARKFGWLLNHRVKESKSLKIDPLAHQWRVLTMLGVEKADQSLSLWPSNRDQALVDDFLQSQWLGDNQKLIGISVSASPRWETKNWPAAEIAKLCELLEARQMRVVLTGTKTDDPVAKLIMQAGKRANVINACGRTTVLQLACLIGKCSVYVSADSAPLHIAAAMKTPVVALFGPTDPARHLPPGQSYILVHKALPCSPCYKPRCRDIKCMRMITAEEVLEAVKKLLAK